MELNANGNLGKVPSLLTVGSIHPLAVASVSDLVFHLAHTICLSLEVASLTVSPMLLETEGREVPNFAATSAASLPEIPTWLGIH